ncbi:uncharacterized protein METZ01_LOCUS87640 [marine metagenome]|jgi:hypothetical protein|uniref:Uncharacterized protein n=1 Tax=marine metagenome TaxID=408172 RepID=A0A381V317_9ZZZZ
MRNKTLNLFNLLHKKTVFIEFSLGKNLIHGHTPTQKERSQATFIVDNFTLFRKNPLLVEKMYSLLRPSNSLDIILKPTKEQLETVRIIAEGMI